MMPPYSAGLAVTTPVNAVYYPNYRVYKGETPVSMNYGCISHVFYAFASLSPSGNVSLSDPRADLEMPVDGTLGCLRSFARLREQHEHLKLILSIGGGAASKNFSAVAASATKRESFALSSKSLIEAHGFQGIDIDWEHPSDLGQGQNFLDLLATVRKHLPGDRYLLTAALPAGRWVLQNIDLNKAQNYLDFLNLMAYDFAGPWTKTAGHHGQLFSDKAGERSGAAGVEYVCSTGFPAAKILLGIPVYGRSFLNATQPGDSFSGNAGQDGAFDYKDLPRQGTKEVVNSRLAVASCVGGDGGFVSYDNPETVKIKAEYCKDNQLGGLFYWTGTGDVASGPRSLISAGFKVLHNLR